MSIRFHGLHYPTDFTDPVESATTGTPTETTSGGDDIYSWSCNGSITFSTGGRIQYLVVDIHRLTLTEIPKFEMYEEGS